MKKKLILLTILISTLSFAKLYSVKDTALIALTKQYADQANISQLSSLTNQATQIQNQIKNLEYQYENLKRLEEGLSNGNINQLNRYINELLDIKENAKSFINKSDEINNKWFDYYKENPEDFYSDTGVPAENLVQINDNLKKARSNTKFMVYDVMNQNGYSAQLTADRNNLEALLESAKDSTGSLKALQTLAQIAGQQTQILMGIRNTLESQAKIAATSEAQGIAEKDSAEEKIEVKRKEMKASMKKSMEKLNKEINQKITIGGK